MIKRNYRLMALIAAIIIAFSSCGSELEKETANGESSREMTFTEETPATPEETEQVDTDVKLSDELFGYRSYLEGDELKFYDLVYECFASGSRTLDVDFDISIESTVNTRKCLVLFGMDHPEFMDWNQATDFIEKDDPASGCTVEFLKYYWPDNPDIDAILAETKEAIDSLAELAARLPTDFDKALFVHDYIINHTKYLKFDGPLDDGLLYIASPYACLVKGEANCAGYAKSFMTVMHRLGIDCLYVTGTVDHGDSVGRHAWNLVRLDGEWYMIDLTWDDPTDLDEGKNILRHDYFCITDEEAAHDHTADTPFFIDALPECTSREMNYYYHLGQYLEVYSLDAIAELFDKGVLSVKFSSEEELEKAIEDLFENQNYMKIPSLEEGGFSYASENRILKITPNNN